MSAHDIEVSTTFIVHWPSFFYGIAVMIVFMVCWGCIGAAMQSPESKEDSQ